MQGNSFSRLSNNKKLRQGSESLTSFNYFKQMKSQGKHPYEDFLAIFLSLFKRSDNIQVIDGYYKNWDDN